MQLNVLRSSHRLERGRALLALVLAALLAPGEAVAMALQEPAPSAEPASAAPAQEPEVTLSPDQLDSLVAPIALYPDPLLGQVLVASTYPLELVQLQQWMVKNDKLKDKALADAVAKQPWDPSIQNMAALPDVVKRLSDEIQWTTDLGNAFLSQQSDTMDAVQRMRKKAQDMGTLKSSEHMKVETQVVENKSVIIVEQAQPEVIYVPSYDPVVVYGAAAYPYPPLYYPPYYGAGAAVAAGVIGFGVGLAIGAAWGGGGWGYGCGWGGNDININRNNNFNRNTNINGGNRNQINGGNTWSHNSAHRGGAPYGNQRTAQKYGGTARGASAGDRQAGARQQLGRQGGNVSNSREGLGGGNAGGGNIGNRSPGGGNPGIGTPGGGDRVGNRSVSPRSSGGSSFGGGSGGMSGAAARSNSSRGSSSMGRSSGGGGGRTGGGGGGRTGGGGGRRR